MKETFFKDGQTFADMNREFQYLWRKHRRGEKVLLNVTEYAANLETMVMNYLSRNHELNSHVIEDEALREKRSKKLVKLWNAAVNDPKSTMMQDVSSRKRRNDSVMDPFFVWDQLIWQELNMWVQLGKPVDQEEVDLISDRRGFTPDQRQYIGKTLKVLNLFQETPHGKAVLRDVPRVPRGLGLMVETKTPRIHHKSKRSGPVL